MQWRIATLVSCVMLSPVGRLWCQTSASTPVDATSAAVVRPGDTMRITVWRKPEFSGEFVVTADGTLTHPLYRRVVVTGVPLAVVESRLADVLKKYETDPQFVVEPLIRIAVGGEVRQPNLYSLSPETTIGQAVALAGGATVQGRKDRVLLIRDGREIAVDLRNTEQTAATPVRSGDRLTVPRERTFMRDIVGPTVVVLGSIAAMINIFVHR